MTKKDEMMKECVSKTCTHRLLQMATQFGDSVGLKRMFVHKSGKVDMTFLFNGTDDDLNSLKIYLNSHFPTQDNCTVFIKGDVTADYDYKIELIDVLVG